MPRPRALITRAIFDEALKMIGESVDVDLWEDEMPPGRDFIRKSERS